MLEGEQPSGASHDKGVTENPLRSAQFSPSLGAEPTLRDNERVKELVRSIGVDFRFAIVNTVFSQLLMPGVGKLLSQTGRHKSAPLSRYRLTREFFLSVVSDPGSSRAQHATKRVRQVHDAAGVKPDKEDFNYVLYTLSHKILDSIEKYDLKSPTPDERASWFKVWRKVAMDLGGKGIPEDESEFVTQMKKLEASSLQYVTPESKQLAKDTIEDAAGVFPAPMRPMAMRIVHALIEPDIAKALDLPEVSELDRRITRALLKTGSEASRLWRSLWTQVQGGHPNPGASWQADD